jgi:hypothetical protein
MKPVRALFAIGLLMSEHALADNVEERSWTVTSFLTPNPFQLNAAALPTDKTIVGGLRLNRNEKASYISNPNNNSQAVKHAVEKKDVALGFLLPLGGAAFGLSADESTRNVTGRAENSNNDLFEEFWIRDYKMKFVVDLLPELRAGFTFRYQSLESDLLGSYGLAAADRTRYRGTMSGYSLGVNYRLQSISLGLFTAPPLRGKITIEGEQKIITDPGLGGVELGWTLSDRLTIGLSGLKWSYKRDERDDDATSPDDQRDIFLRGIDVDQYYRRTLAVGLGVEFAILPSVGIKGSYVRQDGVYLFDADKVPGDDKDSETKVRSGELRLGGFIRNKAFFAEILLLKASRKKDLIPLGRNNIRELGSYEHDASSTLLVLGGAF